MNNVFSQLFISTGASKNIPLLNVEDDSSENIHIAAEQVSLPAISAGVDVSMDKGKAKVTTSDAPTRKRTRRQLELERLGEETARKLTEDQEAEQRAALARFHDLKTREVEIQAARNKQIRKAMDEQYASAALESSEDSADDQLDTPSVDTEAAEGDSTEVAVHDAIYVPGRRGKRMAKVRSSHSKQSLINVNDSDASFIREGSSDDWPEGTRVVLVSWELSKDGLINTIYRLDKTSISFAFLQQILHLVTYKDLVTLYEMVTKYYATHTPEGSGLYLLGDLQVLFDSSTPNGVSYDIWKNNQKWKVQSWKFYPMSYVHVLETTTGLRVIMDITNKYPPKVSLMEKMLQQKLEIPPDPVGNTRLFAESLVKVFKQRIKTSRAASD